MGFGPSAEQHVRFPRLSIAAACAVGLACAAAPAQPRAPQQIMVYEPGTIRPDAYTVVERLWTGTWHSAGRVPKFPDAAAAVAAMQQRALRVGADAITNVLCLPAGPWRREQTAVYCHGLLIKLSFPAQPPASPL